MARHSIKAPLRLFFCLFFCLFFYALPLRAGEFTVYGPENFVRQSGAPVTETRQILAGSANAPEYLLRIYNGGLEDDTTTGSLVSSSLVTLNGTTVADQSNFNQQVSFLEVPVSLQSDNTLTVELEGKPGGTITVVLVGIDNDVPAISPVITPAANGAGWHNTNVAVSFVCTDAISGIASCSDPVTLDQDGANQTVTGTATDNAGNTASVTVTVNLDKTAPVITAAFDQAANANGWYSQPVTISYQCTDSLSGILSCPAAQVADSSGAAQPFDGQATDIAGNQASLTTSLNIDLAAPEISFTSPLDGSIVSSFRPAIALQVSDNLALDNNSLQLTANGVAIAHSCAISGSAATCTLAEDLPGSSVVLAATIADMAGLAATASIAIQVDSDGDGIADDQDQCPGTSAGQTVDAAGCSAYQLDDDGDGVSNAEDLCPGTPAGETADNNGCAPSQLDADADGVTDGADLCPGTLAGAAVDTDGCSAAQLDTDSDGIPNSSDQCPNTEPDVPVGADGCDPTQRDTDGDGVIDTEDAFPSDPNETGDLDGDGIGDNADTDRDGDGVDNGTDLFPDDGTESTDLDSDGIGDNSDPDRDGDGVPNEQDAFPNDSSRTSLPIITIDSPATLSTVGASPVSITGTVDPSAVSLTVNGIALDPSGGSFAADVSLSEGHNTIVARMVDAEGVVSTASISVSLDLTPPYLTVESHEDGQVVHSDTVTITGLVNDIVRGTIEAEQAAVTVNGLQAVIANRSYAVENAPLQSGINTLVIRGVDQVGNVAEINFTLDYQPIVGKHLALVSGQGQAGEIHSIMPQPLVIRVLDENDQPVAGKPVVFRVVQGSGVLAPGDAMEGQGYLATTGADGTASATLKLGQRAGTANHKVRARVVGYEDEIIFHASATPAIGNKLSVNSGNNQRGGVHQPLPAPFVVAVTDEGANTVQGARIKYEVISGSGHFQNDSQVFETVTDSDGRASAHLTLGGVTGLDKQRVTATLLDGPEGQTITAGFTASGFMPGDPGATSISGVVQDNQGNPVPGVTLRVDGTTRQAVADAQGQFSIENVPVGPVHLIADGSTATVEGEFPDLSYNLVTVSGVDNPLSRPVNMVRLNMETAKWAGVEDVTITLPQVPGFKLDVPAGSVTFPDGSKEGYLSVTAVNSSRVPKAPPNGMQPQFIVTIQPTGALFDPPAKLTLPNVDGHAPGAQVEMFSYDHDLEEFVSIGLGTVSKDGTVITSNPGVGIVKAGWHCGAQPGGAGCCSGPERCEEDCTLPEDNCAAGCKSDNSTARDKKVQELGNCNRETCGGPVPDDSDDPHIECKTCADGSLVTDTEQNGSGCGGACSSCSGDSCGTCSGGNCDIPEENKKIAVEGQIEGNCRTETCDGVGTYNSADLKQEDQACFICTETGKEAKANTPKPPSQQILENCQIEMCDGSTVPDPNDRPICNSCEIYNPETCSCDENPSVPEGSQFSCMECGPDGSISPAIGSSCSVNFCQPGMCAENGDCIAVGEPIKDQRIGLCSSCDEYGNPHDYYKDEDENIVRCGEYVCEPYENNLCVESCKAEAVTNANGETVFIADVVYKPAGAINGTECAECVSVGSEGVTVLQYMDSSCDDDDACTTGSCVVGSCQNLAVTDNPECFDGSNDNDADLAVSVDLNRDGVLDFERSDYQEEELSGCDALGAGVPTDKTSSYRPYRFWLNNDYDVINDNGTVIDYYRKDFCQVYYDDAQRCEIWDEEPGINADKTNTSDGHLAQIENLRDLEDFSPLAIRLSESVVEEIEEGKAHIFLKTQGVSINLFTGDWNDNASKAHAYIYDPDRAEKQLEIANGSSGIGKNISGPNLALFWDQEAVEISSDYIRSNIGSDGILRFIFEGIAALDTCVDADSNGNPLDSCYLSVSLESEGAGLKTRYLYLDFRDIKRFYNRATAGSAQNRQTEPGGSFPAEVPFDIYSGPFDRKVVDIYNCVAPPSIINADHAIFVHGWRMLDAEKISFAETSFKRLYWSGYQGLFSAVFWPTGWFNKPSYEYSVEQLDDILGNTHNYDISEIAARLTGAKLSDWLPTQRQNLTQQLHVIAHSMGNVVVSEALRQYSGAKLMNSYAASEAAEVAGAYTQKVADIKHNLLVGGEAGPEEAWRQYNIDTILNRPWDMPPDLYRYDLIVGGDKVIHGKTSDLEMAASSQTKNAYYSGIYAKVDRIVNFFNPLDAALTGWELNQLSKPDNATDDEYLGELPEWEYIYKPFDVVENSCRQGDYQLPANNVEAVFCRDNQWLEWNHASEDVIDPTFASILAHVVPARTNALGQLDGNRIGLPSIAIDRLTKSNYDHSAQFHGYLADKTRGRHKYWNDVLIRSFGLDDTEGSEELSGLHYK